VADVKSWGWYAATAWPNFSPHNQNNLNAIGNGMNIPPDGFRDIVFHDTDDDGRLADHDHDDAHLKGEAITLDGQPRQVAEVGLFTNSAMVTHGQTFVVTITVCLFEDGSYLARIPDSQIPKGVHHSAVDQIVLGTWDQREDDATYTSTRDEAFICFTAGTAILTRRGLLPVQHLRIGDRVLTADNGFQPVRWVGLRRVAGQGLATPVRIAAGALGNDRPLTVSPQHRMLITGRRAQMLTGEAEVLVPARHLINGGPITTMPCGAVTYVHFLCDRHEVVFAEGAPSESFHPGIQGLSRLEAPTRDELVTLFPDLLHSRDGFGPMARPVATRREGRLLALAS
jgi:hypothetical protein